MWGGTSICKKLPTVLWSTPSTSAALRCEYRPEPIRRAEVDDGQLPAYRFGRVIRVRPEDVEAFIESCRIAPGTLGTTLE